MAATTLLIQVADKNLLEYVKDKDTIKLDVICFPYFMNAVSNDLDWYMFDPQKNPRLFITDSTEQ